MVTATVAEVGARGTRRPLSHSDPIPDSTLTMDQLIRDAVQRSAAAGSSWAQTSLNQRLSILKTFRLRIGQDPRRLASSVNRSNIAETMAAEVLPLADACRFLECEAPRLLRERKVSGRGRPSWLWGNQLRLRREPFGIVLVIAPGNYPLMLPGIHAIQALAAGNTVLLKPGKDGTAAAQAILQLLTESGLPTDTVQLLPESTEAATLAIRLGVDKVVLTGSAATGCLAGNELAQRGTPAVMELSGCDAVFVLQDADPELVSDCLAFGLTLNQSQTCIAPRRLFASDQMAEQVLSLLERKLQLRSAGTIQSAREMLQHIPEHVRQLTAAKIQQATSSGAFLRTAAIDGSGREALLHDVAIVDHVRAEMDLARCDLFAPVLSCIRVDNDETALSLNSQCPYALGASVFGSKRRCDQFARLIDAGCVVINDLIVPTADPRVPFSGRRLSGYGVTRGAAGLEEMTRLKAIIAPRPWFRPHLQIPTPADADVLEQLIRIEHASHPLLKLTAVPRLIFGAAAQLRFRRSTGNRES